MPGPEPAEANQGWSGAQPHSCRRPQPAPAGHDGGGCRPDHLGSGHPLAGRGASRAGWGMTESSGRSRPKDRPGREPGAASPSGWGVVSARPPSRTARARRRPTWSWRCGCGSPETEGSDDEHRCRGEGGQPHWRAHGRRARPDLRSPPPRRGGLDCGRATVRRTHGARPGDTGGAGDHPTSGDGPRRAPRQPGPNGANPQGGLRPLPVGNSGTRRGGGIDQAFPATPPEPGWRARKTPPDAAEPVARRRAIRAARPRASGLPTPPPDRPEGLPRVGARAIPAGCAPRPRRVLLARGPAPAASQPQAASPTAAATSPRPQPGLAYDAMPAKSSRTQGWSPTVQASCPGGIETTSPGPRSTSAPSSITTRWYPEIT